MLKKIKNRQVEGLTCREGMLTVGYGRILPRPLDEVFNHSIEYGDV